jgi:polar amino acid transport system permease protein
MAGFAATFLNYASVVQVLPLLLSGLRISAELIVAIVPAAMLLGLLLAMAQHIASRPVRWTVIAYIDLFRAFPPLVLLIFLYSGLPLAGLRFNEFQTVVAGLVLNGGAFFAEIFRSGIESVPAGQQEAARALGLTRVQTFRLVVLPQSVRPVIPPLASNVVELAKATSLAAAVSLPDLLTSARQAQDIVYNPTPLLAVAAVYLLVFWPMVRLVSVLEARALPRRI